MPGIVRNASNENTESEEHLEHAVQKALPRRPSGDLRTLAVDELPVKLTATGVDIHLSSPEPALTLPKVTDRPEGSNDEECEVSCEEIFGSSKILAKWGDSCVKLQWWLAMSFNTSRDEAYLSGENDENNSKTEPRASNTTGSFEWDLIESVSVVSPSFAETDVAQADGAPGEKSSKTGERYQPVENDDTSGGHLHIAETSPCQDEDDGPERAAGTIDVSENLGGIALVGKRGQCTGATVNTGHTNGNHGNHDNDVHEAVETLETSILASNDEGGGVSTVSGGTQQARVIVLDEQTDEGKTKDIEESNTPEDLSNGTGKRLERIRCLGGSQTNELSTGEGESCSDEDRAETLEPVVERTRIVPIPCTVVFAVLAVARTSSKNTDESNDHEDDSRCELNTRRPEFFLGVTKSTEYIDEDDEEPENGHPYTDTSTLGTVPILHSKTSDVEFKR